MQLKWYFLQKGQPVGPLTRDELIEKIHGKLIGPLDLLFRDDQPAWRPALEFDELLGQWQGEIPQVEPAKWVLLVKSSPSSESHNFDPATGVNYKQQGPFSTQEILNKIQDRSVSVSDFIWAPGYTQWYSIYSVPAFQALLNKNNPPSQNSVDNNLAKPNHRQEEPVASELVVEKAPPLESMPVSLHFDDIKTVVDAKPSVTIRPGRFDVKAQGVRSRRGSKSGNWFWKYVYPVTIFLFGAVFVFCLLFVFKDTPLMKKFLTINIGKEKRAKKIEPEKSIIRPPIDESYNDGEMVLPESMNIVENEMNDNAQGLQGDDKNIELMKKGSPPSVISKMDAKPVEAKRTATYLKYKKGNEGKSTSFLQFDTDGSSHMPLEIQFWSERAQVVSSSASFWKTIVVDGKKGRRIVAQDFSLPKGYLYFEASVNDKSVTGVFDVGTKEKGYLNDILLHRKGLSALHQEERFLLIRLLGRFEKALSQFFEKAKELQVSKENKVWMAFFNSWKKSISEKEFSFLLKVNNKNRSGYVHARIWLDAKAEFQAVAPVLQSIHSSYDEEKQQGLKDLKDILRAVRDLKAQAQDATLF